MTFQICIDCSVFALSPPNVLRSLWIFFFFTFFHLSFIVFPFAAPFIRSNICFETASSVHPAIFRAFICFFFTNHRHSASLFPSAHFSAIISLAHTDSSSSTIQNLIFNNILPPIERVAKWNAAAMQYCMHYVWKAANVQRLIKRRHGIIKSLVEITVEPLLHGYCDMNFNLLFG